jgi:hypothetical protein
LGVLNAGTERAGCQIVVYLSLEGVRYSQVQTLPFLGRPLVKELCAAYVEPLEEFALVECHSGLDLTCLEVVIQCPNVEPDICLGVDGHGVACDEDVLAQVFAQAGQCHPQVSQRPFWGAFLPHEFGQYLAGIGSLGAGQVDKQGRYLSCGKLRHRFAIPRDAQAAKCVDA